MGSECIDPRFLDPALVAGEWLASRPCHFTPGERVSGTHFIGGWVDPKPSLDMEKWKCLTLPGLELLNLHHPANQPVAIPTPPPRLVTFMTAAENYTTSWAKLRYFSKLKKQQFSPLSSSSCWKTVCDIAHKRNALSFLGNAIHNSINVVKSWSSTTVNARTCVRNHVVSFQNPTVITIKKNSGSVLEMNWSSYFSKVNEVSL
jgi:hypothetical protein